jgi:hypothetical protein
MGERSALGSEGSKVLEIANMYIHITDQEKGALPAIFI